MRIPRHLSIFLAVLLLICVGIALLVAHEQMNPGAARTDADPSVPPFRMSDRISTLTAEKSGGQWVFRFKGERRRP